ncbi:hypothetical protein RUM44_005209 [Polyplax serrata]|uniref:Uncharacterized protein n=1 Tax=Polyplax serrata TaxID=468196 RepID=A0ABR1AET7_POLSC
MIFSPSGTYGWNIESSQGLIESEGTDFTNFPVPSSGDENNSPEKSNFGPGKGYYWCDLDGTLPRTAVKSGLDKDGGKLYVGRAIHEGEMHPAKIVPNHECAYISFCGEEIRKDEYEFLCSGSCVTAWEACEGGLVPYNAVVGGYTSENEKLYIGRVFHDGTLTPGKIQPSREGCLIPYGGEELLFSSYEVLILHND